MTFTKAFGIALAMVATERNAQGAVTLIQLVSHLSLQIQWGKMGTLARTAAPETGDRKEYRVQGERLPTVRNGCNWNQGPVEPRIVEIQTGHPVDV